MRHKNFFALIFIFPLITLGCSPDPNRTVIAKAEQSVKQSLKDPDSAEFSDERVIGETDTAVVCGRVNAKNSFGGYVGYHRFFFDSITGTSDTETGNAVSDAGFDVLWNGKCTTENQSSN